MFKIYKMYIRTFQMFQVRNLFLLTRTRIIIHPIYIYIYINGASKVSWFLWGIIFIFFGIESKMNPFFRNNNTENQEYFYLAKFLIDANGK